MIDKTHLKEIIVCESTQPPKLINLETCEVATLSYKYFERIQYFEHIRK